MDDGEHGRAQAALLSLGIHGITPAVLDALRQRTPPRCSPVPAAPPDAPDVAVEIRLRERYRRARRRRGAGPSGRRNEYLHVLARHHLDERAAGAVAAHERFAAMVVMARLPPWFYLAWSCVCLVPIRRRPKPGQTAATTPPRPICVGCSDLREITAELTAMGEATYRDHLLPQQLAVGVSDAGGRMVHAARISVQAWLRRVLLLLDATDAYQHVRRSVVLERMAAVPGLEVQTRFWHARSACSPYQFVGADQRRLFDGVPGRAGDSDASSTLALRLGVGRRVFSASHGHLVLDRWGFALELGAEPAGRCVYTWRTCPDAFTAVVYADALRAGIAGRAEPHSLCLLYTSPSPRD